MDERLLQDAAGRAARYLAEMGNRRVGPSADAVARLMELNTPLPDAPEDPASILDTLDRIGSPATVANASGRFFGFVNGGTLPAALAASWMVSAWDQNS